MSDTNQDTDVKAKDQAREGKSAKAKSRSVGLEELVDSHTRASELASANSDPIEAGRIYANNVGTPSAATIADFRRQAAELGDAHRQLAEAVNLQRQALEAAQPALDWRTDIFKGIDSSLGRLTSALHDAAAQQQLLHSEVALGASRTIQELGEQVRTALEGVQFPVDHMIQAGLSLEEMSKRSTEVRNALRTINETPLRDVPSKDRPTIGRQFNEFKKNFQEIEELYDAMFEKTELEQRLASDGVDVTLPGRPTLLGSSHPVSQMIDELSEIFALLGFQTVFGPEIETAHYNFDQLNIPSDHPARDVWDTIHVELPGEIVLRTHTSPMQARIMEQTDPPVRVIVPGRVYRYEAQDASHEWMFHQLEGLAIDRNITMADLKGVLAELARQLFGSERRIRFRCDFFPFVEPGVDFAVDCAICGGAGCRVCKGSGWLEMGGAGMVHPNVLRAVGYDPDAYSGFAFGLGIERMIMMRSGVDDLRAFAGNDLRFLRQFARAA